MTYDPDALETTSCPLCTSDDPRQTRLGEGGLAVVRCGGCGALYLSPRLREDRMVEHYRSGSYFEGSGFGYTSYIEQERSLRLTFRHLLKVLEKRGLTQGSILEVGCGHGFFLEEAKPFFHRRVGTDLSEEAVEEASSRADQVRVGGVEALPAEERFDLVAALHVIEHVYDPRPFIAELRSRVRVGGHLLLATPNAGSFWFHLLGRSWPSFKFPEHVVFFDRRTLSALFAHAGLHDLFRIPYPHAFPASEVLRKLGFPGGRLLGNLSTWIPATTLALAGRVDTGSHG